jgi:hypothetical protein
VKFSSVITVLAVKVGISILVVGMVVRLLHVLPSPPFAPHAELVPAKSPLRELKHHLGTPTL